MDRIEDCISFIVGKAAQQVARRARDRLEPHGVTPTQYAVLKVLSDADGQTGAELGARLGIDSATTTGVADRLAASGLLERRVRISSRGESEFAGTANKGERPRLGRAVDASAAGGPRRQGQHLDALIVSDGLDIDAAPPGQFADRQGRW